MKFVVKNKEGKSFFSTEYESCVPMTKIDSMNSAGYTFWVDGKKTSLSALKSIFKNIQPPTVYEYNTDPITEEDITIHMYGDKKKDIYPTEVVSTVRMGQKSGSSEDTDPKEIHENTISVPKTAVENIDSEKSDDFEEFKLDINKVGFPLNSRSIICLNNGRVYKTQKDAGIDLNIDPVNISYSMSTGKPYKGYTFRKALEFVK